jgi:hypothetical protein
MRDLSFRKVVLYALEENPSVSRVFTLKTLFVRIWKISIGSFCLMMLEYPPFALLKAVWGKKIKQHGPAQSYASFRFGSPRALRIRIPHNGKPSEIRPMKNKQSLPTCGMTGKLKTRSLV